VLAVPVIIGLTLALVVLGAVGAWWMYLRQPVPQEAPAPSFATRAARGDLFQDDFNEAFLRGPGDRLVGGAVAGDRDLVDGSMVGGVTRGVAGLSHLLRRTQNGFVRSYAMTMLAGIVAIIGLVWVMQ
jgi:NADH-quinone oxidoreductase subunit L